MNLKKYLEKRKTLIDTALDGYLPKAGEYPPIIHRAMRYSVISKKAKRIRPILTLASCEAVGGKAKDALPSACAIELIHTYSLIHDDLPSIDNADYRRGRLSSHKKFGPAVALLCGDALLSLSFGLLTKGKSSGLQIRVVDEVSRAIGTYGMIGGQVAELALPNKKEVSLPTMQYIHTHKTGRLIATALKLGALIGGANAAQARRLFRYGEYVGFCFQIIDDVLDGEGYALAFGIRGAREEAGRLVQKAKRELKGFDRRAEPLRQIADFILERKA